MAAAKVYLSSALLSVALGAIVGACGGAAGGEDCTPGNLGCECSNGLCQAGLECNGNVCTSPGGTSGAESETAGSESASGTTGGTEQDGPTFLSFGTNGPNINDMAGLTVTAVLTDPDGVDDIIGGSLTEIGSGASLGGFVTAAAEGSYSINVTWTQINAVAPLDPGLDGSVRSFRAEFFDMAGHLAWEEFTVTLDCQAETNGVCGGLCIPFDEYENCGGCAASCPVNTNCNVYMKCTDRIVFDVSAPATCGALCATEGGTCELTPNDNDNVGTARYGGPNGDVPIVACDDLPSATHPTTGTNLDVENCTCGFPTG